MSHNWLMIRPDSKAGGMLLNVADDAAPVAVAGERDCAALEPRLEISIDERYLFGLLTRLYHWNNAEIGSHYRSLRRPDRYRPEIYRFLDMLQV